MFGKNRDSGEREPQLLGRQEKGLTVYAGWR